MIYRDIKPKREKCVTSLCQIELRNTYIPCVVLAKDGNSQETFPVLQKEEARNPDLFFNPSVNNLVSEGSCQKPMLS